MAKLYFNYSTMNAGKTTMLLQASYNYQERGMRTVLLIAAFDERTGKGIIGSRIGLVVVLNEVRGDNFEIFEQSGERARAESLGAKSISIRHLPDTTMQKLDARSTSFWAAAHGADKAATGIGLMERQRIKVWLGRAYEEIGKVGV